MYVAVLLQLEEMCILCHHSWDREQKEAYTMVPPDSSCAFFHSDPAVYAYYITVINLGLEYNYMLSAMSLSGKSSIVA